MKVTFKTWTAWLAGFSLLACFAVTVVHAEIVVRDDAGQVLRLPHTVKRIVSLAPHVTESLYTAGAGDLIVGTVDYSDYPEAAKKISRVGGYSRVDLEAIIALKPDLVIAWESGNAKANVDKLRAMGLKVYITQPNKIDDLASTLERYGQLAGTSEIANKAAANLRTRFEQLRARYTNLPKVRMFYQIWKQPLMTIGGPQIISDVIRLCGGENVFGQINQMSVNVTVEAVLAANPEVIVASGMGDSRPEWLNDWARWTSITAVARDNLFFIPPELIQRHTSRVLDGAERLCQQLETARSRRVAESTSR